MGINSHSLDLQKLNKIMEDVEKTPHIVTVKYTICFKCLLGTQHGNTLRIQMHIP